MLLNSSPYMGWMDGWKLVNALHTGMTSQGPPETSPVSLVPCQTCLKAGEAMLVDRSLTQMGTRWIEYDLTKTFFQVLIVTGGRTPDPNDSLSTMPIDTTELLLPAASSWVRRRTLKRESILPDTWNSPAKTSVWGEGSKSPSHLYRHWRST